MGHQFAGGGGVLDCTELDGMVNGRRGLRKVKDVVVRQIS